MWKYSQNAISSFLEPNGHLSLAAPMWTGRAGFEHHELELQINLAGDGRVSEAGFRTQGSPVWNASGRTLIRMLRGRSLAMLKLVEIEHLRTELGVLPEEDAGLPCLPMEALADLLTRARVNDGPNEIICACMQVTRQELIHAIQTHQIKLIEEIRLATAATSGCSSCRPDVEAIMRDHCTAKRTPAPLSASDDPILSLIEDMIEGEIRPALRLDKGDIEVLSLNGKTLTVRLQGACRSCASSETTLKHFVEDRLKALVDPGLVIEAVA